MNASTTSERISGPAARLRPRSTGVPPMLTCHPDGQPLNRRTVAAATERGRLALADPVLLTASVGTRVAA